MSSIERKRAQLLLYPHQIPLKTVANFYFTPTLCAPILFHKQLEQAQLWRILSHANMDRFQSKIEGKIVFSYRYRTYLFEGEIVELFEMGDRFIKVHPRTDLTILQRRSSLRIPYTEPFFLTLGKKKLEGRFVDLSQHGCKIALPPTLTLQPQEKLLIEWSVNGKRKRSLLRIIYTINQNGTRIYGALFERIDLATKHYLRNLTYSYLQQIPQLLPPSCKL